jgi:hypothetical protein
MYIRSFKELKATLASDARAIAEGLAEPQTTPEEAGSDPETAPEGVLGSPAAGCPSEPGEGLVETQKESSGAISSVNSEELGSAGFGAPEMGSGQVTARAKGTERPPEPSGG